MFGQTPLNFINLVLTKHVSQKRIEIKYVLILELGYSGKKLKLVPKTPIFFVAFPDAQSHFYEMTL